MIDQIISGQLSRQLIQDQDWSIALDKGFILALNYEPPLLKLNSSEQIKLCCFQVKINDLLWEFTSLEFTEAIMAIY